MFKRLLPVLLASSVSLLLASPAMAEFSLQKFAIGAQNGEGQQGTPDAQAGSHPYSLTTTYLLNPNQGDLKDVQVELPPGFVGDPNATPKCSYQQFVTQIIFSYAGEINEGNECSNDTAVGMATTYLGIPGQPGRVTPFTDPVYNLVSPKGVAAEFGFIAAGTTPILLETSVRTGTDYGLTTNVSDINQALIILGSKVTIWGVPASPAHNPIRGHCERATGGGTDPLEAAGLGLGVGEDELEGPIYPLDGFAGMPEPFEGTDGCASSAPETPLLTNPTSCGQPRTATFSVDSWEEPGNFSGERTKSASLPELSGCEKLDFSPTLTVTPDKPDASTSSGLAVNVKVPQETALNPVGLTEADVRDTTVVLPPGVALNPSSANGLEACSNALIGFEGFREYDTLPGIQTPTFFPRVPGGSTALLAGENALFEAGVNFCANASKIGTVRFKTPLLEHELTGAVYLAAQEANPFGSLMATYFVAEDPVSGATVKLPGEVTLCKSVGEDPPNATGEPIPGVTCQAVGQVVTTLLNTPQFPVEEFEAHFFGGEKAPLTTPAYCGTYTTKTSFVSWSGETKSPSAPMEITNGPNSGPCTYPGQALPFSPALTGGALNVNAGAFSPFTATMSRSDGEQNLQSLEVHLPPGLSGILSNVELCPEPQANEGKCGANSLIGETTVSVGVGGDPYTDTGGKFYLTGPYNGTGTCNVIETGCAPFGITFEVPAKAGPFDLAHTKSFSPPCDCILVRGKIEVNPLTAAITITSNPPGTPDAIPTSIEGIPLEIQHINATTTRGNFQFNPTNCDKMEVTGTIHSSEGGTDTIGVPFQVTNCQALKFEPKISVSTKAQTSKADGASLTYRVTYPNGPQGTYSNIRYVKVELPEELPSRLTTLQKACTQTQFQANPAGCPGPSVIGHAKAIVPNIPVPLEGPVYFVSNGGEAFPNLVMVLQGDGVTIDLIGDTLIKNGVTSTTFNAVPDNPLTSFEINLPEGPYSALAANGNLCKPTVAKVEKVKQRLFVKGKPRTVTRRLKEQVPAPLTIPSDYVGQNGATYDAKVPISVTGCPKAKVAKKVKKHKAKHKAKKK